MNLVLTLKNEKKDAMLAKVALSIAMESYSDLQNGFGILLRKHNVINISKVIALIKAFDSPKDSGMLFDVNDVLLLVAAFDITLKVLASKQSDRFVHAFRDDFKKRMRLKTDIMKFCSEMLSDLSNQAIYRSEVEQQKIFLKDLIFDINHRN